MPENRAFLQMSHCGRKAPGRAQNPVKIAKHFDEGSASFDILCQKCFCVTFDKSNKTYSASDCTSFVNRQEYEKGEKIY
jgi:hypothetical protein